jgi:hypothetical protein
MAYPTLLPNELMFPDPASFAHVTASNTLGPYIFRNSLYIVVQDHAGATVEVWKSIDLGVSWNEVDAANHPSCKPDAGISEDNGNYGFQSFSSTTDPRLTGIIYVCYIDPLGPLRIKSFDTNSDTWGSVLLGGPDFGDPAVTDFGRTSVTGCTMMIDFLQSVEKLRVVFTGPRDPGSFVGPGGTILNPKRVNYVDCSLTGTWDAVKNLLGYPQLGISYSTPVAFTANFAGVTRTHCFAIIENHLVPVLGEPVKLGILHISISDTGTLGAEQVLTNLSQGVAFVDDGFISYGAPAVDPRTGEVVFPFGYTLIHIVSGFRDAVLTVFRAPTAINPAWSSEVAYTYPGTGFVGILATEPMFGSVPTPFVYNRHAQNAEVDFTTQVFAGQALSVEYSQFNAGAGNLCVLWRQAGQIGPDTEEIWAVEYAAGVWQARFRVVAQAVDVDENRKIIGVISGPRFIFEAAAIRRSRPQFRRPLNIEG